MALVFWNSEPRLAFKFLHKQGPAKPSPSPPSFPKHLSCATSFTELKTMDSTTSHSVSPSTTKNLSLLKLPAEIQALVLEEACRGIIIDVCPRPTHHPIKSTLASICLICRALSRQAKRAFITSATFRIHGQLAWNFISNILEVEASSLIRNAVLTADGFGYYTPDIYRVLPNIANLAIKLSSSWDPSGGLEGAVRLEELTFHCNAIDNVTRLGFDQWRKSVWLPWSWNYLSIPSNTWSTHLRIAAICLQATDKLKLNMRRCRWKELEPGIFSFYDGELPSVVSADSLGQMQR